MFRTALLCTTLLAVATPSHGANKELIVLLLVDAMRPDHMGCYGYDKPTTPVLDALAKEGRRYQRVYANAPWTRPSTACFLTGLHASRHRTETGSSKLPKNINTLAKRLKQAGWFTAGFVANGNGGSLARLNNGFDLYRDPSNTYTKARRGKTYNGLPTGPFLIDKTMQWLQKTKENKVFLFLFLVDPHDPYYAPKELEKLFLGDFKGKIRRRALWERDNNYPEEERLSMQAVYDAGIRYSDQAIGTFIDALKKMGLYETATLLVTADHGEGFGEHGFYLHAHHFWDEVIRIPLLARGPRFSPGVDSRLSDSLDIAATVLDLAGASTEGLPGHSLLKAPRPDPRVISEYNEFGIHRQAIIGRRYKVIWQRPADEAWYLRAAKKKAFFPSVSFDKEVVRVFDMEKDASETKDLAVDMPAQAGELLEELRRFVDGAGDAG